MMGVTDRGPGARMRGPHYAKNAMSIRIIAAVSLLIAGPAWAQTAVIALENKAVLDNGAVKVVANPRPDGLAVIDLGSSPPRLLAQIDLPSATVLGLPTRASWSTTTS